MSTQKHKQRRQKPGKTSPSGRGRWLAAGVVVAIVVGVIVVLQPPPVPPAPPADHSSNAVTTSSSTNTVAIPTNGAGPERLVGSWLRPDGGYVLEIRSATADGKLEARYLNPRPINVARAEWQRKDGKLHVFVELRDVNYPGSTYTLEFAAAGDRLSGIYFQAAQGQNFDVEFVRQK